jgi:hypothetical protein
VTHRGLADSFLVATAHHQEEGTAMSVPPYSASTTVILLMARGTAVAWQQQLLQLGYPPELPLALISRGCTPEAQVVETTVASAVEDLERAALETPLMAVVGWVVTLRSRLETSMVNQAPAAGASVGVGVGDERVAFGRPREIKQQEVHRSIAEGAIPDSVHDGS